MNHTDEEHIYDVTCIGNYTNDTVVSPSGERHVDGGAVNYAAHAAIAMGLDVAVVTRLAQEDYHVIDTLNELGADCFVEITPQSTLMKLEYPTTNIDQRNLYVKGNAGTITVESVESIKTKAAVVGTSFRTEVGLDVIHALRERVTLLAADVQGFVRVLQDEKLTHEPWAEMEQTLACLDIVKTDGREATFLTGETDLVEAARKLNELGPKEVLITHNGGVLLFTDNSGHEADFYPQKLVGRTGRGDTCLSAYIGKRLSELPKESLIWAAALTSLKMETEGPFHRDICEVEELVERKYA
jgi:sugar/nucleoside kinase (ribokinase family)